MRLFPLIVSVLLLGCTAQNPPRDTGDVSEPSPSIPSPSIAAISSFPPISCAPDAEKRRAIRARHIFVLAFASDARSGEKKATPDELRAAYSKLTRARLELLNGASFDTVWQKYSDKNPAYGNVGGDIGFFKKGVMVPEFEKAAFCLPVGEVSPVIRTVFGFHVIQVTDVRR